MRTHALSPAQHAVLRDIVRCRTAVLGGHADVCDDCGRVEVSYNSCRNRHCPKCQSIAQARWLTHRLERLLPTHYFHAVFTLPSELHPLVLANPQAMYDLVLTCAGETLTELGRDRLGAQLGVTEVLHTWTRELLLHPHVHCIVTGGGLSVDGKRWVSTRPGYLLPVRVLGALFRGKFLARVVADYDAGKLRLAGSAASLADRKVFARLRDKLYRKRWHVYVKPPFGGPEQVFQYVGRYTHRVGLSNRRLLAIDERGVTFRTRDDATVTLSPNEFLRRFVLHVLPKGFVKIRHYGLLAAGNVPTKLLLARSLLAAANAPAPADETRAPSDFREVMLALTGVDLRRCPVCGGNMTRHPLAIFFADEPLTSAPPPPDTS